MTWCTGKTNTPVVALQLQEFVYRSQRACTTVTLVDEGLAAASGAAAVVNRVLRLHRTKTAHRFFQIDAPVVTHCATDSSTFRSYPKPM